MGLASQKTWISIARAAEILDETTETLRKKLQRAKRSVAADGVVEVSIDGIRARRLGRHWKVQLSAGWMEGTSEK